MQAVAVALSFSVKARPSKGESRESSEGKAVPHTELRRTRAESAHGSHRSGDIGRDRKIPTLSPSRVTGVKAGKKTIARAEELLYQVTKDDSYIGSVERSVAHRDQILHRAGMMFLIRSDGKILLQRRSATRASFPSSWDSSSSFHVTFGESYQQAAKRELKEETGLSARPK